MDMEVDAVQLMIQSNNETKYYYPRNNTYLQVYNHLQQGTISITDANPDHLPQRFFVRERMQHQVDIQMQSEELAQSTSMFFMGVAVGIFYADGQLGFNDYSALSYDILCPPRAGGDLSHWLYLTATNRTSSGVEAYIVYYGTDHPYFQVFDWSITEENKQWQRRLSPNETDQYRLELPIGGQQVSFINVLNITRRLQRRTWVNEVLLYHPQRNQYDRLYMRTYDYNSDDRPLPNERSGSWGPIVETDHRFQSRSNTLGFANALLLQDGQVRLLLPSNSYVRNDQLGLNLLHIDPNHTFLVR